MHQLKALLHDASLTSGNGLKSINKVIGFDILNGNIIDKIPVNNIIYIYHIFFCNILRAYRIIFHNLSSPN